MNYRSLGEGVAQIGIKICDFTQQGKGYGPRFLRLLIRHLFTERGYTKIVLDTNVKTPGHSTSMRNWAFGRCAPGLTTGAISWASSSLPLTMN